MEGNLSFIGGIHGVGKSTICASICQQMDLHYLSASQLIKWKEINTDPRNKKVTNIPDTQDRLITGLKNAVQSDRRYLLDGHYCLLDKAGKIIEVPVETFKEMKPVSLHLIIDDIVEIKRRLEARDAKTYDASLLEQMQYHELRHAKNISSLLNLDLSVGTQDDYTDIITTIKRLHAP